MKHTLAQQMPVYIGFDPGGKGRTGPPHFGWCVLSGECAPLRLVGCGVAAHAAAAVVAAVKAAGSLDVVAAGIDAPLFWQPAGPRIVDKVVRQQVMRRGGSSSSILAVNSLQGACLIQGIMAAILLRRQYNNIVLTETHPKALLWLLGLANATSKPNVIFLANLSSYVTGQLQNASEDMRDAVLGAYAAFSMIKVMTGWSDLYPQETNAITILNPPPKYWMPI